MQPPFRMTDGVIDSVAGYAGGTKPNPTYDEVSSGSTGYLEAVQVNVRPGESHIRETPRWYPGARSTLLIPMASLLTRISRTIQPFSTTMRSRSESRKIRRKSPNDSGKFNKPVATEIRQYTTFYPAEDYHQDYDRKNPGRYKEYKILSGREGFIDKTWDESQEVRVVCNTGMLRLPSG